MELLPRRLELAVCRRERLTDPLETLALLCLRSLNSSLKGVDSLRLCDKPLKGLMELSLEAPLTIEELWRELQIWC